MCACATGRKPEGRLVLGLASEKCRFPARGESPRKRHYRSPGRMTNAAAECKAPRARSLRNPFSRFLGVGRDTVRVYLYRWVGLNTVRAVSAIEISCKNYFTTICDKGIHIAIIYTRIESDAFQNFFNASSKAPLECLDSQRR